MRKNPFHSLLIAALAFFAATSVPCDQRSTPANPGMIQIDPRSYSRVAVLSDVHGMFPQLQNLLFKGKIIDAENRWIGRNTLLVVVGDSIDKGADSLDILTLWISLIATAPESGGRVVHLIGNHEAELLANPTNDPKDTALLQELKRRGETIAQLVDTQYPDGNLLRSEPFAALIGRWLFCHAGLFPAMKFSDFQAKAAQIAQNNAYGDPLLSDDSSLLEAKDWWKDASTRAGLEARMNAQGVFGVVFGHQPEAFGIQGRSAAIDGGKLIKIDNGMAPEAGSHPGSLLIFDQPALMMQAVFPSPQVMQSDGTVSRMSPETIQAQ
jgi:hypothetical protein